MSVQKLTDNADDQSDQAVGTAHWDQMWNQGTDDSGLDDDNTDNDFADEDFDDDAEEFDEDEYEDDDE